jgi:metal-responsive CopG/Arc/MetJ family transcriptional regulator
MTTEKNNEQKSKTFYIPETLSKELENEAKRRDMSTSQLVRKIFKSFLDNKSTKPN